MAERVTHHDRLADLAETEHTESQRHRALERDLRDAEAELASLREQQVAAIADEAEAKARQLAGKRAKQEERLEELRLRTEAAARRATRAGQDRERFEQQHAHDLLAELEPQAAKACDNLAAAAAALLAADGLWHQVSGRVTQLLAGIPGADARGDAPATHPLLRTVHEAKSVRGVEITSPMPHFRHQQAIEERDRAPQAA